LWLPLVLLLLLQWMTWLQLLRHLLYQLLLLLLLPLHWCRHMRDACSKPHAAWCADYKGTLARRNGCCCRHCRHCCQHGRIVHVKASSGRPGMHSSTVAVARSGSTSTSCMLKAAGECSSSSSSRAHFGW
jgi:hypothetical protein